jgi:hypothetical protein
MVIDHADGLHEGITDGRAYKAASELFQVVADLARQIGLGGNPGNIAPRILDRAAVNVPPKKGVQGTVALLDIECRPGVLNGRLDFQPVADDSGVGQQFPDAFLIEPGDYFNIKTFKSPAVVFSFFQNGDPAQPGLGPFKDQELKQRYVIMQGNPPFKIVIGCV